MGAELRTGEEALNMRLLTTAAILIIVVFGACKSEMTIVLDRPSDGYATPVTDEDIRRGSTPVVRLREGDRVTVVRTEYKKDYARYEVRTSDGRLVYLISPQFHRD